MSPAALGQGCGGDRTREMGAPVDGSGCPGRGGPYACVRQASLIAEVDGDPSAALPLSSQSERWGKVLLLEGVED